VTLHVLSAKLRSVCLAVVSVASISCSTIRPSASSEMTAADVLSRVCDAYGSCETYRDSGMMFQESTDLNGDAWPADPMDPRKGARAARPFRTAWTRSGRFRFEYVDSCDPGAARYVIWASGMDVRAGWGEASETSGPVTLEHALGAASGVSWGVSGELPIACLVGIKTAATILPSGEETAELISDECIMGRRCMRIRLDAPGRPPFGPANQTLWIDAETFLVRRIESTLTTAISEIHILVEYSPEANPSLSGKDLDFEPNGHVGSVSPIGTDSSQEAEALEALGYVGQGSESSERGR